MDSRYEMNLLPLDTPDDDPRWAGFLRQALMGFLERQPNEENIRYFREFSRADQQRNRAIWAVDSGLPDFPVATFVGFDKPVNVGAGRLVNADLITDVTVRASHRRQGLLRTLMTAELTEARDAGAAFALLTASEGGIYGRFGFGVCTQRSKIEIDCTKFELRTPATGSCEYATRQDAGLVFDALIASELATQRGAIGRPGLHRAEMTGEFLFEDQAPSDMAQLVVHCDDADHSDGMARLIPVPHSTPGTVKVDVLAANSQASLALWDFVAHIDLVEKLTASIASDDPLFWALANPRAVTIVGVNDVMWVRMLNPAEALSMRGWAHDGSLVLQVDDPMELAAGTWRIDVSGDQAQVAACNHRPDATVGVDTLGQLYYGGIAPFSLAQAGLIEGDAESVVRLFSVPDAAYVPWGF